MEETKNNMSRLGLFFLEGWHPYFWLGVICFFLYIKTMSFNLTYFDDNDLIVNNYWFLRDFGNFLKCFKEDVFLGAGDHFYRPMMLVSLMLDAQFGGTSPAVYHFTNILLHAGASCLLFFLFIKLSYGMKPSFFISVLFAVHPALTQAVAWIPGRNDSLLFVFAVTAFIFFIEYVEKAKPINLFFTLLFFNLSLFTKETALMLIPAGFLYYRIIAKDKLNLQRLCMVALGLLFSVSAWSALKYFSAATPQEFTALNIKVSLAEVLPGLVMYMGKIVFPFNLSVYPTLRDTPLLYGYISVVLTAAALFLTPRARLKHSIFGLAWFLLFILPPFLLASKMRLEHRLYLPIAGFFIVLAEVDRSKTFLTKKSAAAAGVIIITIFACVTFIHSDNFMDRFVYWKSAVKTSPHSSLAHSILAVMYLYRDEKALSEQELLKAVELDPLNQRAHIDLGIEYTEKGMFIEAEREFKKVRPNPADMEFLYYNYGLLCFADGRDKDSEFFWKKTLQSDPNYIFAYRSLAAYYFINGDTAKTAYYSKQLKDKFSYSIDLPSSTIMNRNQWLSYFEKNIE